MKNNFKTLIPCAGFGTRVGMKPNESKELLINPETNQRLIQYHIDLSKKYGFSPLVITRPEKTDLIEYCKINNIETVILPVGFKGEWMDSLLYSQDNWGIKNILLLPDTQFSDSSVLANMRESKAELTIATHHVTDGNKWGMVKDRYENVYLDEKPNNLKNGSAWGILGFNKETGIKLLTSFKEKKSFSTSSYKIYKLGWFKDLTR